MEPSTVGSTEAAALGLLGMAIFLPGAPMWMKVLVAALAAGVGTLVFLALIGGVRVRNSFTVPLIGIIYGGVLGAVGVFLAVRYDLLQSLTAWQLGSFAGVNQGRYELLWVLVVIMFGDNARTVLPWVAILGATLTLTCDIFARVVIYPLELPIGSVLGVVGAALFLIFLLRFAYNDKGVAS